MHEAFQALQGNDYARVRELLGRYRTAQGADDPRAWEWYYLQAVCREPALSFRGHQREVMALAWSPDGKWLASGGADGMVKVWDPVREKEAFPIAGSPKQPIVGVAWSPDGKWLASAGAHGLLRFWDAASGKEAFSLDAGAFLGCVPVAWSPDSKRVLLNSGDTVRLYEASTGKQTLAVKAHAGDAAAWSPDGRYFASAGTRAHATDDREVAVWDASRGQPLWTGPGHRAQVVALAWSADGRRLASADVHGAVRLWEAATGKATGYLSARVPRFGIRPLPVHLAWDATGKRVSLATREDFWAWDAATGVPLAALDPVSPRARYRFTGPGVRTLDAQTGKLLFAFTPFAAPEGEGRAFALSPDGRHVAAGGTRGTVRIWSPAPAAERMVAPYAAPVAWAPQSQRLVLLDGDMAVKSWDVLTGKQAVLLPGQSNSQVVRPIAPEGGPGLRTAGASSRSTATAPSRSGTSHPRQSRT
jgi:WD40 repeat protein